MSQTSYDLALPDKPSLQIGGPAEDALREMEARRCGVPVEELTLDMQLRLDREDIDARARRMQEVGIRVMRKPGIVGWLVRKLAL